LLLHVLGIFVGTGQLRNIDAVEEEAGVDARRFFGENLLVGLAGFAVFVLRATQVAARAVGATPRLLTVVSPSTMRMGWAMLSGMIRGPVMSGMNFADKGVAPLAW
jgi:hypothetical protein